MGSHHSPILCRLRKLPVVGSPVLQALPGLPDSLHTELEVYLVYKRMKAFAIQKGCVGLYCVGLYCSVHSLEGYLKQSLCIS